MNPGSRPSDSVGPAARLHLSSSAKGLQGVEEKALVKQTLTLRTAEKNFISVPLLCITIIILLY